MNVLVAYMSRTGNTQKICEAIFDEIVTEKTLKRIEDVDSLEGYDVTFLGLPIEMLGPNDTAKAFLQTKTTRKKIALVLTHGAPENAPTLRPWIQKFKDAACDANVLGVFNCQGQMAETIINMLLNHPDPKAQKWGEEYIPNELPDASSAEKARAFARDIMKTVT